MPLVNFRRICWPAVLHHPAALHSSEPSIQGVVSPYHWGQRSRPLMRISLITAQSAWICSGNNGSLCYRGDLIISWLWSLAYLTFALCQLLHIIGSYSLATKSIFFFAVKYLPNYNMLLHCPSQSWTDVRTLYNFSASYYVAFWINIYCLHHDHVILDRPLNSWFPQCRF